MGFLKFVSLTVFQCSFSLFVTFDIMPGRIFVGQESVILSCTRYSFAKIKF